MTQNTNGKLDIALVLDNSGSMKKNDPHFLMKDVVTNFLGGFVKKTRFSMIVFDSETRLVKPLMDVGGLVERANFLKSLEQVNYRGLFSDTPNAVERAIYELRLNGGTDAEKIIILLTDGIVDTGDKAKDLERTKWLKYDLTKECNQSNISIFGIAFTDDADFSLIQSLAVKTGGEYFRAFTAGDIQNVFNKINQLITQRLMFKKKKEKTLSVQSSRMTPSNKTSDNKNIAVSDKIPSGINQHIVSIPVVFIGIFVFILSVLFIITRFKNKSKQAEGGLAEISQRIVRSESSIPRAELIDVKNITNLKTISLTKKLIKIGRDINNDISIPKDTVSSFHATIEYRDGFFYLEDQRSRNKTRINDQEINHNTPTKLKSGDVILFNMYKFIFILPDLIPAGETVIDFGGKTNTIASYGTAEKKGEKTGSIPQAMVIDIRNITGKKTMAFYKDIIKIGRGVQNDVDISESSISGSHATIQYRDQSFYIEDLRSTNKTRLNGIELEPYTPMKLKSGDELIFDVYKFIFLLEKQTPSGETDEHW